MKRNQLLVCALGALTLASCSKFSELDPEIEAAMTSQTALEFTTYASSSSATRGTAINSNENFQTTTGYGSFDVAALVSDMDYEVDTYDNDGFPLEYDVTPTVGNAVDYFYFTNVQYQSSAWVNQSKMYWPNYSKMMHFAAYSPASVAISNDYTFTQSTDSEGNMSYVYSFPYSVSDVIGEQVDLMYAMTSMYYICPSDRYKSGATNSYVTTGAGETNEEDPVNLHFKHALTQIAFTATKDAAIDVYVKGITLCNLYNNGVFTATLVTDDLEADAEDNPTVGENATEEDATTDLVDAGNFGTWTTSFDKANGWGSLTAVEKSYKDQGTGETIKYTAYYTTTNSGGHTSMSHYEATLADLTATSPLSKSSIEVLSSTDPVALTSSSDVLMVMPQKLTAWTPTTATEPNFVGLTWDSDPDTFETSLGGVQVSSTSNVSLSYLAIDCEIYHSGIENENGKIHDGYIFVPFDTKNIAYSSANTYNKADDANKWLAGYKITYLLNFGGGYVVDEDNHDEIPEPGCVPDTETFTLSTITYTTTVDSWIEIDDDCQDLDEYEN